MKKYISIIGLSVFGMASSQVIIGDDTGTSGDKTSVLLEFAAGQNKGLILPYVKTLPSGASLTEGTLILDASNGGAAARVMYYNGVTTGGATGWVDLSNGNTADIGSVLVTQPDVYEDSGAKTIIGASTSSADGVLVLESASKAMVLPIVESTDDVPDPAPGMMVYLNKVDAKRLAVFNGEGWTYWKP